MSLPVGRITYTITIFFHITIFACLFRCEFFFFFFPPLSGAISIFNAVGGGKHLKEKEGRWGGVEELARATQKCLTLCFECCLV